MPCRSQKAKVRSERNIVATRQTTPNKRTTPRPQIPNRDPQTAPTRKSRMPKSAPRGMDNHFESGWRLSAIRHVRVRFNFRLPLTNPFIHTAVQATGKTNASRSAVRSRNTTQAVGSTNSKRDAPKPAAFAFRRIDFRRLGFHRSIIPDGRLRGQGMLGGSQSTKSKAALQIVNVNLPLVDASDEMHSTEKRISFMATVRWDRLKYITPPTPSVPIQPQPARRADARPSSPWVRCGRRGPKVPRIETSGVCVSANRLWAARLPSPHYPPARAAGARDEGLAACAVKRRRRRLDFPSLFPKLSRDLPSEDEATNEASLGHLRLISSFDGLA